MTINFTNSYAAYGPSEPLKEYKHEIRTMDDKSVHIKIKYCGICHSDIHQVKNEWCSGIFPMVPGHEIAGIVHKCGSGVTKFKNGDRVGVGCMVGSCRDCESCFANEENYCPSHIGTYNCLHPDGQPSYGGYSRDIVVHEHFVCKFPDNIDLCHGASLLCAGITTYNPMKLYGMDKPGLKIGVLGLGGLGHMAVKLAVAFGNDVTIISHTPSKKTDSQRLGAKHFISGSDSDITAHEKSLDYIIDTVSVSKNYDSYMRLLKTGGALVTLGVPKVGDYLKVSASMLIQNKLRLGGSVIGGMKQTQEMLDFCGKHNVVCDVEMISIDKVNDAYARVLDNDVKFRFVIDMDTLSDVRD